MGKRLVAVPFSEIRIVGKEMQLPDATKDALKSLPEFKYAPISATVDAGVDAVITVLAILGIAMSRLSCELTSSTTVSL